MADEITTTTAAPAPADTSAAAALTATPATAAATQAAPAAATPTPATEPGLTLPGKDATPEAWSEFYGKLGRPEKSSEYELTVREGEDAEFVGQVADVMHKYGLTKSQAQGLQKDLESQALERIGKAEEARIAALDAKNKAEQAELKNELGEKFDGQMELAKRAVRQFAGAEQAGDIITAIEDKIGYKATMQFFMSIGHGLGEHDAGGQAQAGAQAERIPTEQLLYGKSNQK